MGRKLFDKLGFGVLDVLRGISISISSLSGSQLHVSWDLHSRLLVQFMLSPF